MQHKAYSVFMPSFCPMRRYCNKKAGFASGFFIVCRLLALEAVVVVWQFALAFAAIRQADFQETVANHESEVAGVRSQHKEERRY